jgi:aminopeptidase YwaD
VRITTVEELAGADVKDAILLLCGEIAREQLMPKNFPFYKPETHQRIIHGLEAARPGAVVAATSRSPALAGGVYPFPLIEDGDFTIPNAYMTDMEGERLARFIGAEFELAIDTVRRRSHGHIVIARKGPSAGERVVFMAHIDAKPGTPGALDNATGVATLLLLAELLADYDGALEIEIVAINGEDHYANPGERLYLEENRANFHDIILGVNLDGLGYIQGRTAYSLYGTTTELERSIQGVFARRKHLCPGQTWFQSDHALFVMHDRPAIALTSEHFTTLWSQIAHTPGDTVDLVSCDQLALTAICLRDLVQVIAAE